MHRDPDIRRQTNGQGVLALVAGIAVLSCTVAMQARADEEPGRLTFNAGAFSQYIFRGLTQTNRRPALQAGADYASRTGLYVGTWLSNISWVSDTNPGAKSPVEWDLYAGYRRSLSSSVGVDVGILRYAYPGRHGAPALGGASPNTTEAFVAVTWNAVSLKYAHAVTNTNGIEHSVGSSYLDFSVNVPLGPTVNGLVHVGRQTVRGQNDLTESLGTTNAALYTYSDFSAGLSARVTQFTSASIVYTRTTAKDAGYLVQDRNLGSPHLALGLVCNF